MYNENEWGSEKKPFGAKNIFIKCKKINFNKKAFKAQCTIKRRKIQT